MTRIYDLVYYLCYTIVITYYIFDISLHVGALICSIRHKKKGENIVGAIEEKQSTFVSISIEV